MGEADHVDIVKKISEKVHPSKNPSTEWIDDVWRAYKRTSLIQLYAVREKLEKQMNVCRWLLLRGLHDTYQGNLLRSCNLALILLKMELNKRETTVLLVKYLISS